MFPRKSKGLFKRAWGKVKHEDEELSPFQYRTLDAMRKEIRLLSLQPAPNWNEPIHCQIRHVLLDNADDYFALSYA
jgi:hypothetical protein